MKTLISYITWHNDLNNGQMKKNDIRIGNNLLLNGMYIICVEFLHEFQNLYWALCRKELEIEL